MFLNRGISTRIDIANGLSALLYLFRWVFRSVAIIPNARNAHFRVSREARTLGSALLIARVEPLVKDERVQRQISKVHDVAENVASL